MTRRIIDDHLYAHFITFGCYKHRQLLTLDQPKRFVLGVLNQELWLWKPSASASW